MLNNFVWASILFACMLMNIPTLYYNMQKENLALIIFGIITILICAIALGVNVYTIFQDLKK